MPLSRLRSWLPNSWHSIESTLPNGSTAAGLLSTFISSVSPKFRSGTLHHGEALTEAVIGILVSALSIDNAIVEPSTLRDAQWLRVKKYIDAHLHDPELSPRMIAAANGISIRYLHCLSSPKGLPCSNISSNSGLNALLGPNLFNAPERSKSVCQDPAGPGRQNREHRFR
jgi:hypothetical protein